MRMMNYKIKVETLQHKKLLIYPPISYPSCHAPTICETPSGSLLLAFYAGVKEGAPDSVVLGAEFKKRKRTWTAPEVWVHVVGRAVANPRLFVGPDQAIWLLVGVNYGTRWCSGDTYLFVKKSWDEGNTWSDLELFCEQKGLLGKNKPFNEGQLWIIPVEWERTWSAAFFRSDNNGSSWELVDDLGRRANAHLIQPAIAKLSDGRLVAYMRSQEGYVYVTFSTDAGKTWSTPMPTTIPNNNSGLDVLRTQSGLLLLACNPVGLMDHPQPVEEGWPDQLAIGFTKWGLRTPLCLLVSQDDGATWDMEIVLEDGAGEYSYPALLETSDGVIHIVYTYRRRSIGHIMFAEETLLKQLKKGGKNVQN